MIKPKGFSASIAPFTSGSNAVLIVSDGNAKGISSVSYLSVEITVSGSKGKPIVFEEKFDGKNISKGGFVLTGTSAISVTQVTNVTAVVKIESRKKQSDPLTINTTVSPPGKEK